MHDSRDRSSRYATREGGGADPAIFALLVEDSLELCLNIREYLEVRGYVLEVAHDGLNGLRLARARAYDVIVLDLGLPGMDGLVLCRKLREEGQKSTPLLMLTARETLKDKVTGLESGADDYLVKPFAPAELDARLRALVRRSRARESGPVLKVADLELDLDRRIVTRAGREISLTPTELRILEILMRESHRVVPRREIERAVWQHSPPDSDALRSHLHGLRKAIDKPFGSTLVRTVHGVGYRLSPGNAR